MPCEVAMFDNKIPDIKKINKTAVAVVAAVLVGGYVFFGLKSIDKKKEAGAVESQVEIDGDVNIDAPQFIRSRTYNDVNVYADAAVDPASTNPMSGTDAPAGEIPPPTFETNAYEKPATADHYESAPAPRSYDYYSPPAPVYREPAPVKKSKKEIKAEQDALADNSPSGWKTPSAGGAAPSGGYDYAALTAGSMANAQDLARSMKGDQDTRTSHERFLDNNRQHEDVYLNEKVEKPVSPFQIMAGTIIPCTMISGIDSDLPGQIVAQVRGQVYDSVTGKNLLIPHGTKFIGAYDSGVLFGQQRCLFAWKRMIFPDGRSIQLQGMSGADLAGYAGVKDTVDFHYMRLTGAVLMSSFMSAGTRSLDNGNTFRSTMAEDINKSGQKIVDMQLNVQPTIKIAPATPFNIMVNKDIVLSPYRRG